MSPIRQNTEIWIHPARYSGKPCVGGTRVPVDAIVGLVWQYGVDDAMVTYDVPRETVLVACWYAGLYGTVDPYISRRPGNARVNADRTWIRRWRDWAEGAADPLWRGEIDDVLGPPTFAEATA